MSYYSIKMTFANGKICWMDAVSTKIEQACEQVSRLYKNDKRIERCEIFAVEALGMVKVA